MKSKQGLNYARKNATEEWDLKEKFEVINALRKYGVRLLSGEELGTSEKWHRSDLVDKTLHLIIELDGDVHRYNAKARAKTITRGQDYETLLKTDGYIYIVVDTEVRDFLGITNEQYLVPILRQLKETINLNVKF